MPFSFLMPVGFAHILRQLTRKEVFFVFGITCGSIFLEVKLAELPTEINEFHSNIDITVTWVKFLPAAAFFWEFTLWRRFSSMEFKFPKATQGDLHKKNIELINCLLWWCMKS